MYTLKPIMARGYIVPMIMGLVGRGKSWETCLRGRARRGWIERMVGTIIVFFFFFFIAKAVLIMRLGCAPPILPSWNQRRYLILYHLSYLQWFPVANFQFFDHFNCNVNCSVVYNIEWKVYVPGMTCITLKCYKFGKWQWQLIFF